MIKGYRVSENEDTMRCACEIDCGGAVQFKAELSAILKAIKQNKALTYLMAEVIAEIVCEEEEEENEDKQVS